MRFLKRESATDRDYAPRAPYPQERARLLARPRPEAAGAGIWAVLVDLGLRDYLLSVFVFADGTISILGSGGIRATGLRGAPSVAEAAAVLLAETAACLPAFSPSGDAATEPLPARGEVRVIARTEAGDVAATGRLPNPHGPVGRLSMIAERMAELAHEAVVEGFEPAEAGDFLYSLAPHYRRMRQTLLEWISRPEESEPSGRVAGVAVEFGEGETVTSLFAFDDGSIGLYRSDGSASEEVCGRPGAREAARRLRQSVDDALDALEPSETFPLPQPGLIQWMARTHATSDVGTRRLRAVVPAAALAAGEHPLSGAFGLAMELRGIATGDGP